MPKVVKADVPVPLRSQGALPTNRPIPGDIRIGEGLQHPLAGDIAALGQCIGVPAEIMMSALKNS
jgi:hypothetical protein